MNDDDHHHGCSPFLDHGCCPFLIALVTTVVLVAAFGVALPVRATVTYASLSRLDHVVTSNCTGTAAAASVSVAYNVSLTVQLRNRNWAMWVELAAPLDAEIRFVGQRLDAAGARLADPGWSLPPRAAEEFRLRLLAAVPSSSPGGVALGGAGAAAELARQRSNKVFEVELRITGEVRYHAVHAGRSSRLKATCSLKMLMPNVPPPRGAHLVVLQTGVVSCY